MNKINGVLQNNQYYLAQTEIREKTETKPIKGIFGIGFGSYLGEKAITSGIRRTLGVRIETHTTTKEKARKIIEEGCILDPKYGGSGVSKLSPNFSDNSKNFIHITGLHKDGKKVVQDTYNYFVGYDKRKNFDKFYNSFYRKALTSAYRKSQQIMYKIASSLKIPEKISKANIIMENFGSPKLAGKTLFNLYTGRNSKTFYIGGTDSYFNKNFTYDVDDIALKTDKPLKVCKTKLGAVVDSLKKHGLSGMKENKSRVLAGIGITTLCGYFAYKLINDGLQNLGLIHQETTKSNT